MTAKRIINALLVPFALFGVLGVLVCFDLGQDAFAAGGTSHSHIIIRCNNLKIQSGTTFTISDVDGNAGPVFTDAGTTIDVALDGGLTVQSVIGSSVGTNIRLQPGGFNSFDIGANGGAGFIQPLNSLTGSWIGSLLIDGTNDVSQLAVQGVAGQTALLIEAENSAGVNQFTVSAAGATMVGAGGTPVAKILKTDSASIDLGGAITATCTAETNVSIPGVAAGDSCTVNTPAALAATDWVVCRTLLDNVALKYCSQGVTVNPASMVYSITTIEF